MDRRLAPRSLGRTFVKAILTASLAALGVACTFVAEADPEGAGIGSPCASDDDCHASQCLAGACSVSCTSNADCPEGTVCASSTCQLPLSAGFLYVGVPQDEGWTKTHEEGRVHASEALPYLSTEFVPLVIEPDDVHEQVDLMVSQGRQVIFGNSFSMRTAIQEKASQYPDVKFLTCASNVTGPNLGSYFGRSYEAWYLAGYAAGKTTQTGRLGFLGSFVTPEVVRHINAFAIGAQRARTGTVVEVRWEGFWFDTDPPAVVEENGTMVEVYDETELTNAMLADGCDVIAHNSDVGRSVRAVEAYNQTNGPVYSIGNDNIDACDDGPTSCLGVPYWNWGPLYVDLIEQIHRGTWDPYAIVNDSVKADPALSIINFGLNPTVASAITEPVGQEQARLIKGDVVPFAGPLCSTGQRAECVAEGAVVADDELNTMCWFVDGVVQKSNPFDPQSEDIPAFVPDGTQEVPAGSGSMNFPDCNVNI